MGYFTNLDKTIGFVMFCNLNKCQLYYKSCIVELVEDIFCHDLNLGLATKARACKSAGQEGSLGVTFHAPGSAKECEGMNLYTPKGTPTLGVGVSADSRIFRERLQGSKFIGLRHSLYH
jgi:hypothetical protein